MTNGSTDDGLHFANPSYNKGFADTIRALIEICRPKQWAKNAFVFAPLIFAKKISIATAVGHSFGAFILFCCFSSCVYIINDIADIERDRLHPDKKRRPLPSGRLSARNVLIVWIIVFSCSSACAILLDPTLKFLGIAWLYTLANILYSFWWRAIVILDGMTIALGFVLRTYAGAVVIDANFSDWLYICAIFVSLFLAFSKRRHEILLLGDDTAPNHRAILKEYSTQLLDQIIAIVTAATAVTYSLYCIDSKRISLEHTLANADSILLPHDGSVLMKFTIPFVLYGLFRYLYLVYSKEKGGNPTEILLSDKPLLLNGILWLAVVFWALYS
ncbi:MAG: decaprenyl-phosphate phosphoribosyltransferase [Candidatus Omnitrophota bacterium]|jgi:4-hydroxybenzoate polyprenyltransferase|nr:MAG: decaprenyl-phosphate phosphoribosyltransferase [Candidatus Omnitrophota bacterium]